MMLSAHRMLVAISYTARDERGDTVFVVVADESGFDRFALPPKVTAREPPAQLRGSLFFVTTSFFASACSGTYKLDELEKRLDITGGPWGIGLGRPEGSRRRSQLDHAFAGRSNCEGVSRADSSNWGIERSDRLPKSIAKPWVLVSDYNSPQACGDRGACEIRFSMPESLLGSIYHTDALTSLLQSKVAKDNYIHPGETLLTPASKFLVDFAVLSARADLCQKAAIYICKPHSKHLNCVVTGAALSG